MPTRYEEPAALPPTVADLWHLLRSAEPTRGELAAEGQARETERADAVGSLLALARAEVSKTGDPNQLRAMPPALREFLELAGLRILLSSDPISALNRFLGGDPKRGRPVQGNESRDIRIAAAVANLHDDGKTIDAACREIGDAAHLSPETVRGIYYERRCTAEVLFARVTVAVLDQAPG